MLHSGAPSPSLLAAAATAAATAAHGHPWPDFPWWGVVGRTAPCEIARASPLCDNNYDNEHYDYVYSYSYSYFDYDYHCCYYYDDYDNYGHDNYYTHAVARKAIKKGYKVGAALFRGSLELPITSFNVTCCSSFKDVHEIVEFVHAKHIMKKGRK